MAVFVINEWLWAYASGSENDDAQRRAFEIVSKLSTSDHRVVVVTASGFVRKEFGCFKNPDIRARDIAVTFFNLLQLNPDRCITLDPDTSAALTDALAASTKDDDHYLVRALLTVPSAVLVTTDNDLRNALTAEGYECLSPEEFLNQL